MEDKQHDFILILAGYSREMDQFLALNPGLHSRFPIIIHFPDYTAEQLMEIGINAQGKSIEPGSGKEASRSFVLIKTTADIRGYSNGAI